KKIAPDAVNDLKADEVYHNEVRLQWTIPVDEDNFQPAYIYLAASGSEINANNFDIKQQMVFSNPFDAGTVVQVNIGGLIKETDYWFAMKTEDQFGNISDISNVIKITTTDAPQFELSNNKIDVDIDVTVGTTYSEMVKVSNIGEGIIYWQNYVENERIYWWLVKDEEENQEEEELTSAINAQLTQKIDYAEANPQLFEVNVNPETHPLTLKSTEVVKQPADYWDYDQTVFTSGMSYEGESGAVSILATYNPNAGLVQATRFNVDYDYTFNLTHLEVAMYNNVNDKPIIVELRKGSTRLEESEVVYLQEYYSDTTEVFGFQRIPLYEPQRFEDGEIFWVVLHFPKEDQMPLGLGIDTYHPDLLLMSRDNGRSFFDLQEWRMAPYVPLVRALSTGDDGAYVFLKPGDGEIESGASQDVEVYVDATNLHDGKHLASVTLMTNDVNKPYVNLEVKVNVSGQSSEIDTTEVRDFNVLQNVEKDLNLELKNTGLSILDVYDITSDDPGFVKNFTDTVSVYTDFKTKVPFKYTASHTGVLQTKINLITNQGVIGLPVNMNSTVPAVMDASLSTASINLSYGETGTVSLSINNDGSGSDLEYDLSHYDQLMTAKNRLPDGLVYDVISSNDVGGPAAGTWDDISEVGTIYDGTAVWEDTLQLGARIPFFDEVMETAWHGFRGDIYFYSPAQAAVQLPGETTNDVGMGVMAPLSLIDSARYFVVDEFIHHSFGDKNIFTVTVKERTTKDYEAEKMTYQVVLYRNGTVEYRYKDVDALTPDMNYTVGLHGMSLEEFVVYKNLDEDKPVSNGLVIRFVPQYDASMVLYASPEKGYLRAGESESANLSIDPTFYNATAGTYNNSIIVK
ncbi:MAG: hypothetical protein MI866_03480, partial [Bacteroidales bacterium]|nr:hypothetical protein [Bacteroidales bacterium]